MYVARLWVPRVPERTSRILSNFNTGLIKEFGGFFLGSVQTEFKEGDPESVDEYTVILDERDDCVYLAELCRALAREIGVKQIQVVFTVCWGGPLHRSLPSEDKEG